MTAAATEQTALFDGSELIHPDYSPRASIEERFAVWHAANPAVYRALERLRAA